MLLGFSTLRSVIFTLATLATLVLIDSHAAGRVRKNESNTHQNSGKGLRRLLNILATTQAQTIYLRDGDLVLCRRSRSLLNQCRYRVADDTWHR